MSFKRILKSLMEAVPGSTGAVFLDFEGEAVEDVSENGDPYHIRFTGAHSGIILNSTQRICKLAAIGSLKTLLIRTEKTDYFTAPVHDGYYVVLAVKGGAPPGRAYSEIESAVQIIRDEMGY